MAVETARPTPTQRVVLRVLAEGGVLVRRKGAIYLRHPQGYGWRVNNKTADVCIRCGWLTPDLTLTDAGREALER